MCAVCRTHRVQNELIRISQNTETGVCEINGARDGRGAYICRDIRCIERAKKKHVIERHLKCTPSDTLYDKLEEML